MATDVCVCVCVCGEAFKHAVVYPIFVSDHRLSIQDLDEKEKNLTPRCQAAKPSTSYPFLLVLTDAPSATTTYRVDASHQVPEYLRTSKKTVDT